MTSFPNQGKPKLRELSFRGKLLHTRERDQKELIREVLQDLKHDHASFISAYPGFGKTACGCYLIHKLRRKTVIVTARSDLVAQFGKEVQRWLPSSKVQIFGSSFDEPDPSADVYCLGVMMLKNIPMKRAKKQFRDVGLVIVDEAHMCSEALCTESLFRVQPTYLVGLSGTPDKSPIFPIFPKFYGNFHYRKQVKPFHVINYVTPFKPKKIHQRYFGGKLRMEWGATISQIHENQERCNAIGKIAHAMYKKGHVVIVICERLSVCDAVFEYLYDKVDDPSKVYLYTGKTKLVQVPTTVDLIVTNYQKSGVGYDNPRLTAAVLDIYQSDIRQFEARVRAAHCTIVNITDNWFISQNHWVQKEAHFLERGATISYMYHKRVNKELYLREHEKILGEQPVHVSFLQNTH